MDNHKITVVKQPEKAYRTGSARDLYWERIQQYKGKTVKALRDSVEKEPPSTPKRGKLAGKPEPLSGWLAYFQREGLVKLVAPKQ